LSISSGSRLYLALIHYPVLNKNGDTIVSAITNLDLHDIARAAKTYGVEAFYVVTPLADQKYLTERIVSHWITGAGAEYNPDRQAALEIIRVKETFREVVEDVRSNENGEPRTVVTSARYNGRGLKYAEFREMLRQGQNPYILSFGTAWGLSEEFMRAADYVLEPVRGNREYNHLSVRSAASIILDRLIGEF